MQKRCTKGRILWILKEARMPTQGACRKHESRRSCVTGRRSTGGTDISEVKRLKELERENEDLKKIIVEQALDIQMPKGVKAKKF